LKILIDGRTLAHRDITGIQRHAIEITKALKEEISCAVALPRYANRYYQQIWEHTLLPFYARRYDLLFSPSNVAPFWHFKSTKLVVTVHDLAFIDFPDEYSSFFQKYYKFLIPWVMRRADRVLTISAYSKDRIIKEYPFVRERLQVIQHGLSEMFRPSQKEKESYVLYVGAMNEIKNFQKVLEIFMREPLRDIPLKMVLPLSDTFRQSPATQKLLADVAYHDNIELIEFVEQKALIGYYQRARIFLFPSFHESFGFPPLEAMACGTPVIVSNTTALPEVCMDAALYVNPHDAEDITKTLLKLYHDKHLQEQMRAKGLQRASQFSWKQTAQKHVALFKEVCHR